MSFEEFINAVRGGDLSLVRSLFREEFVNERDKDGQTPLEVARLNEKVECIRFLEEEEKKGIWIGHIKERAIGNGAFGVVYKCRNPRTMICFVKKEVVLYESEKCTRAVKTLEKEIDLYTKFKYNPYIVRYYGSEKTNEAMYIYLEYMEGGSIKDQLKPTLPPDTIALYTKQILKGLAFLHDNNVIHRDINPDNILLDIKGNVKICDFGISRNLMMISSVANRNCGTLYYTAPEVIKEEKSEFSADIWSLGVTVLEMLTGHTLYPGLNQYQFIIKIGESRKLEYDIPDTTPPELQYILGQMLIYEPKNRPTANTLLQTQFILGAETQTYIWIGDITERVIGRGGFGCVYKCYNPRTKQYFVKKEVLLLVNKQNTKEVTAFEREIDLYTKFGFNPYIVQYYGSYITNEAIFIYLE